MALNNKIHNCFSPTVEKSCRRP